MSDYQYYEFLAIDRPLDDLQQSQVRALSTRAHITATRFTNEYHWGNFRGDPVALVARYYDAHLYFANWGTRRVLLRLPRTVLRMKTGSVRLPPSVPKIRPVVSGSRLWPGSGGWRSRPGMRRGRGRGWRR